MTEDPGRSANASGESPAVQAEWSDTHEIVPEIRELFHGDGQGEVFSRLERILPLVREMGGGSVVGRDASGAPVIHAVLMARSFTDDSKTLRSALLGGLVVREVYQDFWTPVRFLQDTLELAARQGTFDFLYADPGENAVALFRGASFDLLDSFGTFVLPLVPGWPAYIRRQFPVVRLKMERLPWRAGTPLLANQWALGSADTFRVVRTQELYESWVRANSAEGAEVIVLQADGASDDPRPVAQLLVSPFSNHRTLGIVDLLWDHRRVNLGSLFHAVALEARSSGFRRLAIRTLLLSPLGRAMERCGFVPRRGERRILTKALSEATVIPSSERWLLTWLDGS